MKTRYIALIAVALTSCSDGIAFAQQTRQAPPPSPPAPATRAVPPDAIQPKQRDLPPNVVGTEGRRSQGQIDFDKRLRICKPC